MAARRLAKELEDLKKNVRLKSRSSYNKVLLEKDSNNIKNFLKDLGYYFSEIGIQIEELEDNKINLMFNARSNVEIVHVSPQKSQV